MIGRKPCAFDRIDRLVMDDILQDGEMLEYDPDEEEAERKAISDGNTPIGKSRLRRSYAIR